jgi:hypothetical protein
MSERCLQSVTVPGVFSSTDTSLGRSCVRAAGHEGPHRWQQRWEALPPAEVEAEIERDREKWEGDEDDEVRPPD